MVAPAITIKKFYGIFCVANELGLLKNQADIGQRIRLNRKIRDYEAFLRPPLGDLGATYDDHLRLIGKRVVDFLLALIELF